MTNKIDTVLKAIIDRIIGALPCDMVKNPKLSTSPILSTRSYLNMDPQCSNHIHGSINAVTIRPEKQSDSYDDRVKENEEEEKDSLENIYANPSTPPNPSVSLITKKVLKLNSLFESLKLVPQSSNTEVVCTKREDEEVMFTEIIRKMMNLTKKDLKRKEESLCFSGRIVTALIEPWIWFEHCGSIFRIVVEGMVWDRTVGLEPKMRIEQYFLMTDYSLWKVILNGDSPVLTRIVEGVVQPVAPTTAEQKLARKNELKARGTLLMALFDKHQLKFNSHKDAKTLME
nr:hypothetical protein [Tanacetum cinerariifolium]